ncbi:MAG: hypothetical protein KY455_00625 [Euryarchaeota archaeon]|nr:hypothetical protein [Euryarchaeota archaeon]
MMDIGRLAAALQGTFWTVTGVWPILHLGSFEAVTGPKTDDWLVRVTGLLIAVVGVVLLWAALRPPIGRDTVRLGLISAAALGLADVVIVATGAVGPVYLLDVPVEAFFVGLWSAHLVRSRSARDGRGLEGGDDGVSDL